MKKTLRSAIAALICVCMLFTVTSPIMSFAATTAEATTEALEGFETAKIYLSKISEKFSVVFDALASVYDYMNDEDTIFGELPDKEDLGSAAYRQGVFATIKRYLAKVINFISDCIINGVVARLLVTSVSASGAVLDYEEFNLDEYGGFYNGMDAFSYSAGSGWRLGYAQHSIMPADFGEKEYAKGAYLPYISGTEMYLDDDGVSEELRVRTIVFEDGSGRGKVAFCVLDAIGLCNADVRLVREALADFAAQNNIVSINVSCTHIHTGIDSQGVWTDPVGVLALNSGLEDEVTLGVDRTFIEAIVNGCKESVIAAANGMTSGSLLYSATDIAEHVRDRTAPISLDTMLYKLEFVPDNAALTPTLIASFGCHPESASYDWKTTDENGKTVFDSKFSSDFIWYMEKLANAEGYNFIYIQGDVGTATSSRGLSGDGIDGNAHDSAIRYGYEIGYILLGMNMTEDERIALNERTGDKLGIAENTENAEYTVWYEGLETVAATEIEPILNIAHAQFTIEIENYAMAAIGKTSISDNLVLESDNKRYYTVSEVGFMQLGNGFLNVYLSPGETFGELLKGGAGIEGFPYASIRDTLGENTIIFDLTNDAAGYVANDKNFVMVGLQYNELTGELDSDTWCLISYGRHAGSTFIGKLYELYDSVK